MRVERYEVHTRVVAVTAVAPGPDDPPLDTEVRRDVLLLDSSHVVLPHPPQPSRHGDPRGVGDTGEDVVDAMGNQARAVVRAYEEGHPNDRHEF